MPHVVGIDPSLKRTAVFVLNEAGEFVSRRCFPAVNPHIGLGIQARVWRNQCVGKQIRDFLTPLVPEIIAFEAYAYGGGKFPGHHDIIEHGYELRRMLCALLPLPRFLEIPPSTLKRHATGAGNAEKAAMVSKMTKRFEGIDFTTDDEADAAGLALFAQQAGGYAEPSNEIQRDSLKKIVGDLPALATQGKEPF